MQQIGWNTRRCDMQLLYRDVVLALPLPQGAGNLYDGSNDCQYLAFFEALQWRCNSSALQRVAPSGLIPEYRNRYYRYIAERQLEDQKWFHEKYTTPRDIDHFLSKAFDAGADLATIEWLQSIHRFTKQEVLSQLYSFFRDHSAAAITVSTWPLSAFHITFDELLRSIANKSVHDISISYLEAFSDYYHINLTESPWRQLLPDSLSQLHQDFLDFRFKQCSSECCLRLVQHSHANLQFYWANNDAIVTRTRNCRYLRFDEALTHGISRKIIPTSPERFESQEELQYYATRIYFDSSVEILRWFLEKYQWCLEKSLDRFASCFNKCADEGMREKLEWEMDVYRYTKEEFLEHDHFHSEWLNPREIITITIEPPF